MTDELADGVCVPCRGGVPPLAGDAISDLLAHLAPGWRVVDGHHLEKVYAFPDYRGALDFTLGVGELAEAQGHHPDLLLVWGKVTVTIWTHKIDGLTEGDFIFAAKTDRVRANLQ